MKNIKDLKAITIEQFVSLLFEARNVTHINHLKSKSYSEHKALNEFYSEILELADEFIETYQGQYGIINITNEEKSDVDSSITYLTNFVDKIRKYNFSLDVKDSHLKNIIDEMTALTYKTLYKLKNLK